MRLTLAATLTLAITLPALGNIKFIEDNYQTALKQARAAKKPLFVEAWAPW